MTTTMQRVANEVGAQAQWDRLRGVVGHTGLVSWAELPPALQEHLVWLETVARRYAYIEGQLHVGNPVHLGHDARCGVVVRVAGRVVATGGDEGLGEALDQVLAHGPM